MAVRFNKRLLVEGIDDKHVILALCNKFDIPETFEIIDCKGIDILFEQIPVRIKEPDIEILGIIIDADSDLLSRWENIKQIFAGKNFKLPKELPKTGLIVPGNITIGIWIMPNNNLNGMLEDFVTFLVPANDKLLPIINENLNEIEVNKLNKYKPVHKSKAVIHSWLSVQEEPGTPMGLSITKRYLTTDEKNCASFVQWLNDLFNR